MSDSFFNANDLFKKYTGVDSKGNLKSTYIKSLMNMDDHDLIKECEAKIWLSTYASLNPDSDYHWQCDACYDECIRRSQPDIYKEAWQEISKDQTRN